MLKSIILVVEKAEVFNKAGNDAYRKKDFAKAIFFYTEGIKVECKDKELVSKLYNNRSTVYFYQGKFLGINNTLVHHALYFFFTSKTFSLKGSSGCLFLFYHCKRHNHAIFRCVSCFPYLFVKRKRRDVTNSGFQNEKSSIRPAHNLAMRTGKNLISTADGEF